MSRQYLCFACFKLSFSRAKVPVLFDRRHLDPSLMTCVWHCRHAHWAQSQQLATALQRSCGSSQNCAKPLRTCVTVQHCAATPEAPSSFQLPLPACSANGVQISHRSSVSRLQTVVSATATVCYYSACNVDLCGSAAVASKT